ncbi:MAG: nuclear transport factor 2 family protein [Steroidobacteraceae bacterium]
MAATIHFLPEKVLPEKEPRALGHSGQFALSVRRGVIARRFAAALLLAFACAGCAGSGGGGLRSEAGAGALPQAVVARRVQEIGQVERQRFAAMVAVDAAALDEVLSERLRYCHSDGRCETKGQFLEALQSGRMRYVSIDVLELEPKAVGTAMLVQGRLALAVEQQGQPLQLKMAFTDVYESTPTGWRLVAWQSTRLP